MKKIIVAALSFALAFCLVGCGSRSNDEAQIPQKSQEELKEMVSEYRSLPEIKKLMEGVSSRLGTIQDVYNESGSAGAFKLADEYQSIYDGVINLGYSEIPPELTDLHHEYVLLAINEQSAIGMVSIGAFDEAAEYVSQIADNLEEIMRLVEEITGVSGGIEKESLSSKDDNKSTPKEESAQSEPSMTPGQSNALKKAGSYLNYSAFSYTGLIEQLEYEKFSNEDAVFAADNCGADWNEQAAKKADSYLKYSAFSRDGLIDQLVYEGYTYEQAVYGVDSVGL